MEITFGVSPETTVVEYEGIQVGSRLLYQAAGLDIYIVGSDPDRHPDCIPVMAMNACIARHIPVVSLHGVGSIRARSVRSKTETRDMFDEK